MFRATAIGVLASFALNLVWENAQAFLYRGYQGLSQHFWTCFIATLGDVIIVAAIYGAVAVLWHDYAWYRRITIDKIACAALFGLGTAIVIEAWALQPADGPTMGCRCFRSFRWALRLCCRWSSCHQSRSLSCALTMPEAGARDDSRERLHQLAILRGARCRPTHQCHRLLFV